MLNALFTKAFSIFTKSRLAEMGIAGRVVAHAIPDFPDHLLGEDYSSET